MAQDDDIQNALEAEAELRKEKMSSSKLQKEEIKEIVDLSKKLNELTLEGIRLENDKNATLDQRLKNENAYKKVIQDIQKERTIFEQISSGNTDKIVDNLDSQVASSEKIFSSSIKS